MSHPLPSFSISVDMFNPGQVIACCGLLELAHRRWPGAEGWFGPSQFTVGGPVEFGEKALCLLVESLARCEISGLSGAERDERDRLEILGREQRKKGSKLTAEEEKRRKELGERARAGVIRIGEPFEVTLNWWDAGDEQAAPKTWAGLQELHKIARAAQDALAGISEPTRMLDYGCVLRTSTEYRKSKSDGKQSVEPFYFDARRYANALHTGFSLDAQELDTTAYPAVELLCLIGLQRFRPAPTAVKWAFDYWVWSTPLSAQVVSAVFSGVSPLPGREGYRFHLRFRDDQKRYKAFGPATRVGVDS